MTQRRKCRVCSRRRRCDTADWCRQCRWAFDGFCQRTGRERPLRVLRTESGRAVALVDTIDPKAIVLPEMQVAMDEWMEERRGY